jgi:hypothetical protein
VNALDFFWAANVDPPMVFLADWLESLADLKANDVESQATSKRHRRADMSHAFQAEKLLIKPSRLL